MLNAKLPVGWSTSLNRWREEGATLHLETHDGSYCENGLIDLRAACGRNGESSRNIYKNPDTSNPRARKCKRCERSAAKMLEAIDHWTAEQCHECMTRLNGESVWLDVVAADLDFYREHCRWIMADHGC